MKRSKKDESPKYICSEFAVNRLLRKYNQHIPISKLKDCESLENMIPCIEKHLKDKRIKCELSQDLKLEKVKEKVQEGYPIALRIQNPDKSLHTITIEKWNNDSDIKIVDDTGKRTMNKTELKAKRYGNYGLYCKRK